LFTTAESIYPLAELNCCLWGCCSLQVQNQRL